MYIYAYIYIYIYMIKKQRTTHNTTTHKQGKTCVFSLGALQTVDASEREPQAGPKRERGIRLYLKGR